MLLLLQSNDDEILSKQKEAERILSEARAAAQKQIQDAKSAAQEQQTKRLAEVKAVRGCCPRLPLALTVSSSAGGVRAPRIIVQACAHVLLVWRANMTCGMRAGMHALLEAACQAG